MRSTGRLAAIGGIIVVALIVGAMAYGAANSDHSGSNSGMSGMSGMSQDDSMPMETTTSSTDGMHDGGMLRGMSGPFDRNFIDNMVPHHQLAVAMARLVLQKPKHQEVAQLARAIIAAQNGEITSMRTWRERWYGSSATPAKMAASTGMSSMGLDELKSAKDRERTFLEQMIPHHQSAITMATEARKAATHSKLRRLATQIIKAQKAEIGTMRAWLKRWYGVKA